MICTILTLKENVSLENTDFSVFTFGGCVGPERIDFQKFPPWKDAVVLPDSIQFTLLEDMVVLK